jgi:hydroxypyruvate reductase
MPPDLALLAPLRAELLERLRADFTLHPAETSEALAALAAAQGGRIRGAVSNGMRGLPREAILAFPRLEICAISGVGLESTDLELARARGIVVTTTPVLHDDVADLAVLLGMATCRRLVEADRFVRRGLWQGGRFGAGRSFSRRRVGILGLGRIGLAVARRLAGFGVEIGYCDPLPKDAHGLARYPDAVALARWSDLLILTAAGGASRAPLVTAEVLEALGEDGIFVNVARGWLVDEAALIAALCAGRIAGAGLDVFANEPDVPEALRALDNVVLTPHIASGTVETAAAMSACVADNLHSWFAGRGALTPVP